MKKVKKRYKERRFPEIHFQSNICGSIAADYTIVYAGLVAWQLILQICSQYKGVGMGTKYHFMNIQLHYKNDIIFLYSNTMNVKICIISIDINI